MNSPKRSEPRTTPHRCAAPLDRSTQQCLHGSQNAITQGFFAEYTTQDGNSAYYVSEVGALIAVAWVAVAFLFWRKRHILSIGVSQ
jgi:hypothetical protein